MPFPLHGSVFALYSSFAAFGVEYPAFGLKAATRPLWALTVAFVDGAWPGRDAGLGVGLVLAYGQCSGNKDTRGSYGCFFKVFLPEDSQEAWDSEDREGKGGSRKKQAL